MLKPLARRLETVGALLVGATMGTVREDYSAMEIAGIISPTTCPQPGYRWGEDGMLGITDRGGRLCFAGTVE